MSDFDRHQREQAASEFRELRRLRLENEKLREVVATYHEWLERVEQLRVCPDCGRTGYMGLDHAIGENVEGCSGCAALGRAHSAHDARAE